ncbi:DUF6090 family protein [Muriicola sp.]|uniref:DUF6090 family protein n=1 Tax=Muriicola sp. TaxID=2020856 RepID=UPI003C730870
MIKFFRKIRQQLLSENKFSKYFLYAIGEIILVVIGILIALQINTWNEGRKDRLKEQVILLQLKDEYQANLQQLNGKMQLRKKIVASGLILLNFMSAPEDVQRDSAIYHLSNIIYDPTFDPIENDLISSGNIRLIRNEKLRLLLSNWTSNVMAVQEQEHINQMHVHEIMLPLFNDMGISRDVLNVLWENLGNSFWLLDDNSNNLDLVLKPSINKTNAKDMLANKILEGVVANTISYNNVCNLESLSLKNRIIEILNLIEIEIQ